MGACGTLVVLAALLAGADPNGSAAADAVVLWRRGDGAPQRAVRAASVTVKLDALPQSERDVKDVRGALWHVRGVPLRTLLEQAPWDASTDAAVIHFDNGTRAQIARTDVARLDVFLARAWRVSAQGAWSSAFEPVPLGAAHWSAARALTFRTHRVFAAAEAPRGEGTFVPWGYVDGIHDVELVRAAGWHAALDVGDSAAAHEGLRVFERRCETCHGARGAGASLGWDFVDPLPLATWRTVDSLYDHVRAHKLADAEAGLLMPAQPDVTKEEITAIHAWMQALAAHKTLNAYAATDARAP